MKRILSGFLVCLMILCAFAGCNRGNQTGGDTTVKAETLTVAGADISEYTIVYAPSYSEEFLSEFEEFLGDYYEHNLETANELAELLSEALGVTLPVVADGTAETAREILIGATNRAASAVDGLADTGYAVKVVGEKLVVAGGSDGAVYHAVDAIADALAKSPSKDAVWNEGEILSGNAPLRRIACIGDSLTEGSIGGHVTPELAYPAALGRLLWQNYVVYNYGLGGTTMIGTSASPYQSSKQYADCLESGLTYDLILVMLGTNDSKVIGDAWTEEANEEYMASCEALFAALAERSPDARFAMMNCPVKFTTAGYGNAYMLPVQKEAATLMKEAGYDVTLYDMRAYTTEVLTSDNFRDGLHPDYAGYALIADGVLELVYHLTDGDENGYLIALD